MFSVVQIKLKTVKEEPANIIKNNVREKTKSKFFYTVERRIPCNK